MDIEKFINEDLGVNINSYIEDDIVYLNAEDVCRGLGFVDKERQGKSLATCGERSYHQPEAVRWSRVNQYLKDYRDLVLLIEGKVDNSVMPEKLDKDTFMPEELFYYLAIKARNDKALRFQYWIVKEVLPAIRKRGYYREAHQDIRDLTKFLYKRFASVVMKMVNFCNKNENLSLNAKTELAKITNLVQCVVCDIPKGQRDFVTTEQLLKLAYTESEVIFLIDKCCQLNFDFKMIMSNLNDMCERFKNNDYSFKKFYENIEHNPKFLNGIGTVEKRKDEVTFDLYNEDGTKIEKSYTLRLIK